MQPSHVLLGACLTLYNLPLRELCYQALLELHAAYFLCCPCACSWGVNATNLILLPQSPLPPDFQASHATSDSSVRNTFFYYRKAPFVWTENAMQAPFALLGPMHCRNWAVANPMYAMQLFHNPCVE